MPTALEVLLIYGDNHAKPTRKARIFHNRLRRKNSIQTHHSVRYGYIPNQAADLSKLPLTKRERPRPGSPTQLALARKGEISAEMHYAALCESISVSQLEEQLDCYALPQLKAKLLPILNRCERISGETVRKEIASRRAVLPLNFLHPEARPMVIGKQFKTKRTRVS